MGSRTRRLHLVEEWLEVEMNLINFLIFGFATWRVASLLVSETGPFGVFRRIREFTGIEHDDDGDVWMIPDKFFPELLSCVWCSSVWIALLWLVFWMLWPWAALRVAIVFAFSTVAILVDERVSSD